MCIASDFHVPCFLINSSGTLFWIAQEAPALLKAWNVKGGEMLRILDTDLRCFRAMESVKGIWYVFLVNMNRGSLSDAR